MEKEKDESPAHSASSANSVNPALFNWNVFEQSFHSIPDEDTLVKLKPSTSEDTDKAVQRGMQPILPRKSSEPSSPHTPSRPLSAEQLAAANLLLDFSDHRSHAAKLRSLGIPTTKYQNWLRIPAFQEYITYRAEYLLNNSLHEAHTALLKNVQRGNQKSIEFLYEITGRYSRADQQAAAQDLAIVLVRLVEVIQRHVKDPETIKAIASEFNEILPRNSTSPVTTSPVATSITKD